jgi:hypothetical protein
VAVEKGKPMNSENSKKASLKQKAAHELKQFIGVSLYLGFFFCAVVTYRMILLSDFHDWHFNYSFALINALVIAKVILIGEYAHLGKRVEAKPLLLSSVSKAILFSFLVLAFHILEEAIKQLVHGKEVAGAFHDMPLDHLLGGALIIFCTFVPFFAFRELQRVLGEDRFHDLFLLAGATRSDKPEQHANLTRNVS